MYNDMKETHAEIYHSRFLSFGIGEVERGCLITGHAGKSENFICVLQSRKKRLIGLLKQCEIFIAVEHKP